ncbi:MAG: VOC family protein [Butyricicoccaceae bacterium]
MELKCILLTVEDMTRARTFYETVFGQKLKFDFGENIQFESGLSLQLRPHFARMVGLTPEEITPYSNNIELYFETEDLDASLERLNAAQVRFLQPLIEHSWGQRVTRFYDPDGHIIEVAEHMEDVVRRFLDSGMSPEQTAERTQHPIEFVRHVMKTK